MTVYTVHEPRPRKNQDSTDPDRFVFVRDGFYFWAFLLGPLWMLWRGLWLVLLLYLVALVAVQAGFWALGLSAVAQYAVGLLFALLVGFEAASLQRWTSRAAAGTISAWWSRPMSNRRSAASLMPGLHGNRRSRPRLRGRSRHRHRPPRVFRRPPRT